MAEPMQEQEGQKQPERTSNELFAEIVDKAEEIDRNLGGRLLKKVDVPFADAPSIHDAPQGDFLDSFYVLQHVPPERGLGLSKEKGPLFLNPTFAREINYGKTYAEAYKKAAKFLKSVRFEEVHDQTLEEWNDGFVKSVELADNMMKKEQERVRVATKVLEAIDGLGKMGSETTHTSSLDNPPASALSARDLEGWLESQQFTQQKPTPTPEQHLDINIQTPEPTEKP